MSQIFKNITFKCIIMLLVVQTLNLSISSLDFYTQTNTPNSIEDQDYVDSMVEFCVENVLGFSKDTFQDKASTNNFSKQQQNNVHFDLKWLPNSISFIDSQNITDAIINIVPKNDRIINLYFKEVPAKPPQVLSV